MSHYKDTDWDKIRALCQNDVATLITKDHDYGSSWRKRGGVGAFMMLARKWDRIETQCQKCGWDIFTAAATPDNAQTDLASIMDDISDLRCYLLLVEEHVRVHMK